LRSNADKNSCLIHGPNTPTTVPYNPSATPDVLDIVITRDLVFPVHLTTCSALISDHLPVLIDTQRRSSFLSPPDRQNFRKTDWSKFPACLEAGILPNPDVPNNGAIDACQETDKLFRKRWQIPLPSVAHVPTYDPSYRPIFGMKYA
jgi:hypothetical protein